MKAMLRTSIVLMFITICSKLLGLGREIALSYTYGISAETDSYIIAIAAPGLLYTVMSAGINSCFVPIYSSMVQEGDRALYTSRLANIFLLLTIFASTLIYFFSSQIVGIYGYGFDPGTQVVANELLRVTCFSLIIRIVVVIYASNLQVKGFFIINNLIGIPMNLIIIASILLSSPDTIYVLSYGFLLAMFSQLALLLPVVLRERIKYTPSISLRDKKIHQTAILILPVAMTVGINEINLMIDIMISSGIAVGAVSALNYALKINILVQSVLVATVVLVFFPSMSKVDVEKNAKDLSKLFNISSMFFIYVISPIALFTAFHTQEIVEFVYGYGQFNAQAVRLTSEALFYYSFGFLFFAFRELMLKTLYSQKDMTTPFKISAMGVLINLILTVVLAHYLGLGGVALATSLACFLVCMLLVRKLKSNIKVDVKGMTIFMVKLVSTSVLLNIMLSEISIGKAIPNNLWIPIIGPIYLCLFVLITMFFKEKPLSLLKR